MRRLAFSLLGLLTLASAYGQSDFTGTYGLRTPEDATRVARLAGRTAPFGRLSLHVSDRFTLEVGDRVRHGRYRVDDDHLTLYADDGETMGGLLEDGRVDLGGLRFEKSTRSASVRRFPTDASTGRLRRVDGVLTVGDPAPSEVAIAPHVIVEKAAPVVPPAVFAPAPEVPVVPPAMKPRVSLLRADDVFGAWTVRRNGLEDKGMRMELRRDGTFHFEMKGATSDGTWTLENGDVVLVWSKIDGDVVELNTIRKSIPVADDASAFQIDTYRYERATDK